MRLTNGESEVNLATGEADPEFSEWKWATPEEVIEQVIFHKKRKLPLNTSCWYNFQRTA